MKRFKWIDFFISSSLVLGYTVVNIRNDGRSLLEAYLVTGSWQVLSMIVHAIEKCFTHKWGIRYIYHWISFIAIVTMPLGSIWFLLFTAPFMAFFYTMLCLHELSKMASRPLAVLK
ncbi:MAG TPA: hypothetical protein VFX58_10140 [Chitinophagaceae bacterium]|nr:hypothetical protein [Chitinophagaceae bacterium]